VKLLIDTHIFLWFINDSPNLSQNAIDLLESDTDILLSIASLWEIAIKVNLKKLTLPDRYEKFIPEQISQNAIQVMPVTIAHLNIVAKLPLHHRDPFDRLLISQAISENLPIISADIKFDDYGINRLW
jgi:PIN domain nuclease of toxin-antitoxin system